METETCEERQLRQAKLLKQYVKIFKDNNYKITAEYVHGFNVVVNELQDIFIRPFNGKKSKAVLFYNSTVFKDIYIDDKNKRKEIGFSEGKNASELFKYIEKRLINSQFCLEQWEYLKVRKADDDSYRAKINANMNVIREQSNIIELRENTERDDFNLYHGKMYGHVKVYADNFSIDLTNLTKDQIVKILKVIEGN